MPDNRQNDNDPSIDSSVDELQGAVNENDKNERVIAKKEPSGDAAQATVTLQIVSQTGESMRFRMKRASLIHRMLDVFCQRKDLQKRYLRFLFDGQQIAEDATPQSLDMDDNDVIEVFSEQFGGK